jgi:uncharacterized membrane protein
METPTSTHTAKKTLKSPVALVGAEAQVHSRHSRSRTRLEAVDLLRGLLMILMVLDHTRIYFSRVRFNPTDPLLSWPALFATRWITYLCAPGFIALAGASVFLQRQRGKSPEQAEQLLITRGLWLLFLDLTLISFGWSFTLRAPFMNVISDIGLCMIGLGFLQRFSLRFVCRCRCKSTSMLPLKTPSL